MSFAGSLLLETSTRAITLRQWLSNRQTAMGAVLKLLGHIEPRVAGRLAIDPGSDFPALFQIETGRLKMEGRQYRARATPSRRFFFMGNPQSLYDEVQDVR